MADLDREEFGALIDEFNQTEDTAILGKCLHHLIEQTSLSCPSKVAVVCKETSLTYQELNDGANRLARTLAERGVGTGCLVAVSLHRSANLMVALLAILKTGAAYVPVDPVLPMARVQQMLSDAAPTLVMVESDAPGSGHCQSSNYMNMEEACRAMESERSSCNLDLDIRPEHLAYVMYTSGSTGRPKGVEISHGAISNFVLAMKHDRGCSEDGRLLAIASISFDMAGYELWTPLVCGATIILAETHQAKDPKTLLNLMERCNVTMMIATPTSWQMLLDAGWEGKPRLQSIMCGGENLTSHLVERLLDYGDTVWNQYGPAEATICASVWKACRGQDVLIGRPISNASLYVLGDDLLPKPLGCAGELYIGGAGIASGYRNQPELTASRFLKSPFHKGLLYRTGDVARFISTHKLSLLGRADDQVKIRGHRIETGDVEAAALTHQDISSAVATGYDGRLTLYLVRTAEARALGTKQSVMSDMLRSWLSERLPSYMVPTFIVELDAFKVTVNGKIDRKTLPNPVELVGEEENIAKLQPANDLEQIIRTVWADVVGHGRFRLEDNFFHIGGDSSRAVQVQTKLGKALDTQIPIAVLFEHYTIKGLAKALGGQFGNAEKASAVNVEGSNSHDTQPTTTDQLTQIPASFSEDIAIISTACRLPGIATCEEYWDLLSQGSEVIKNDTTCERWQKQSSSDKMDGASCNSHGNDGTWAPGSLFKHDDITKFDTRFFGIAPQEAQSLDPMQYMMLETSWEGFERAGYTYEALLGSNTGIFIGISNSSAYQQCQNYVSPHLQSSLDGYAGTGTAGSTMSGRISYTLGLHGPALTVDTACSSSLTALHLACSALRQGECDMALAGGVTLMHTPGLNIEFEKLGGMSPDGRCKAFSENADGVGWGEGCAAVVLKRMSDAKRDGDGIAAVVKSTQINHDGRSSTLTAPSGAAQRRLVRGSLDAAGLQPGDIDYIEAHGTGTKLGDVIEAAALVEVFGGSHSASNPLWVGSAKSSVGHTQAAAGLIGLLKVVLALQHNTIPRTLHVTAPTPAVDWSSAKISLAQDEQAWPCKPGRPRRAGVSAFGVGGTNAHVIIEEAPEAEKKAEHETIGNTKLPTLVPVLLSGYTEEALRQQASKLADYLTRGPALSHQLLDVAFSLATTRSLFRDRLVIVAEDRDSLVGGLRSFAKSPPAASPSSDDDACLAMLFTGQGSQLPDMGKGLASSYPVFEKALGEIAGHFESLLDKPLLQVMWTSGGDDNIAQADTVTQLQRTDCAQAAIFALEVALWRLWDNWGVKPKVILGHSIGEIAAAHVAGIMDLQDACRLVAARGRLMQALPLERGSMASLNAGAEEVLATTEVLGLGDKVSIACYNTPKQTVASGDDGALKSLVAHLASEGCPSKFLNTSHAFHSHHMDSIIKELLDVASTIQYKPPTVAIVSSLTGKMALPGEMEQPSYWSKQARDAVRFSDAVLSVSSHGANVFLELGPRPVLCGLGATCLRMAAGDGHSTPTWIPSLAPNKQKSDVATVLDGLSKLHMRGISVDWRAYFGQYTCQRVQLPTYPFQRESPFRDIKETQRLAVNEAGERRNLESGPPHDHNCHLVVKWRPREHPSAVATAGECRRRTWGLLSPAGPIEWANELVHALSMTGDEVVPLNGLQNVDDSVDGVLSLWDYESFDSHHAHDLTAKALAQLQEAIRIGFSKPMIWITHNAVGTGVQDEDLRVGMAPLWGLLRTARCEHPELRLRLVDLGSGEGAMDALTAALGLDDESECAVRQGKVLVPGMHYTDKSKDSQPALHLDPFRRISQREGAVLVTGGLGGLGQHVVRWLVSQERVRDLILVSRRGMSTPNSTAFVQELEQAGAKVTVVACDIGNLQDMESVMSSFTDDRPLRGIVHTAGVLDDGILSAMTPERCAAIFKPKVDGAWHLHRLTQNMDLDCFVMFSSLSGITGNAGQGNYAAANTFLDGLASLRRAQGLAATSVAWGLCMWDDDGMGATLSQAIRNRYSREGVRPLGRGDGLRTLGEAMRAGRAQAVVVSYDMDQLKAHYRDGLVERLLPPMLSSLLGDGVKRGHGGITRRGPGELLRRNLDESPHHQHEAIVLASTRTAAAEALGFASEGDVRADVPLQDIGIDSLTAVLIRNKLSEMTGLTLSVRVVFDYPNLAALSRHLYSQLQPQLAYRNAEQEHAASSSSSSPGDSSTPASTATSTHSCASLDMALIQKGCLDPEFTFENACGSISPPPRPQSVLVTGATGFVGAFIVHKLLSSDVAVHCLVRERATEPARQRVVDTLDSYDLWDAAYAERLHVVAGDISQRLLGLSEEAFDDLADSIDAICHSGALVDWMRPVGDYTGPNLVSTHEVLRLASCGRSKTVHFVSSAATLPLHLGYDIPTDSEEYGYATSKHLAEKMVAAARWRGATASTYRVPFVTASSASGHFRRDRGDFLHRLIAGSVELGSFPSLQTSLSAVLPVDYISETIGGAITGDVPVPPGGRGFDFGNSDAPSFGDFFDFMVAAGAGTSVTPFCVWREQALAHAAAHPASSLARIAAVLDGCTDKSAAAMFGALPVGRHCFGGKGSAVPKVTMESVSRYVNRILAGR